MRCKKHPKYNPFSDLHRDDYDTDCEVCCDLYNGAQPIGEFPGEFEADKDSIKEAKTILGPMNLAQFGSIRFDFSWDYHYDDDAPMWHVNKKTRTIYLDNELSAVEQKKIIKEYKCRIRLRSWREPKLTSVVAKSDPTNTTSTLSMIFGESNKKVLLALKVGMAADDVHRELSKALDSLHKVPKDRILEKIVLKPQV